MADKFIAPDEIKTKYCPRQYFYMNPGFKDSEFFIKYCASVPCRGDTGCNRAACWEILDSHGPYVQDDYVRIAQRATCPLDFFGRLSEYAHFCNAAPHEMFAVFQADIGGINFVKQQCKNSIACVMRTSESATRLNEKCWSVLSAELKEKQK